MAPLIGITTYGRNDNRQYHLYVSYLEAVRAAGGVPVLLTPGETQLTVLLERMDGLIFTGGGDLNPALYGDLSHPTIYSLDDERDRFDLALARAALASTMPLLGICRGLQTLNLASGGGPLILHVPDQFDGTVQHRQEPPDLTQRARPVNHWVEVSPKSRLAAIVAAAKIPVVSWHHQAIPSVPPGWQLCGWAADGLIEAIEHQHHPWAMAVQWHPEMSVHDGYQLKIFQALVAAAGSQP